MKAGGADLSPFQCSALGWKGARVCVSMCLCSFLYVSVRFTVSVGKIFTPASVLVAVCVCGR